MQRTLAFQRREREGQELLGYLGKMVTKVPITIGRYPSEGNMKVSLSLAISLICASSFPYLVWCLMAISFLFKRIYRYQSHDYAFSSVEKLLHSLGGDDFLGMLNRTLLETLEKAGFSEKFLNEIVAPVMRVNYGQSMDINGFVGKPRLKTVMDIISS